MTDGGVVFEEAHKASSSRVAQLGLDPICSTAAQDGQGPGTDSLKKTGLLLSGLIWIPERKMGGIKQVKTG